MSFFQENNPTAAKNIIFFLIEYKKLTKIDSVKHSFTKNNLTKIVILNIDLSIR